MRKVNITLLFIFLLVLGVRLYIVFGFNTYSYDAYFNIRQIKVILQEDIPSYHDNLSYGGKDIIYMPIFHILLANAAKIFPLEMVLKILPNLVAACLVFVVYLITKSLTGDNNAALFSAFISGFVPIYLSETLLTISPVSLFIPLFFLQTYYWIEEKPRHFVLFSFILSFVHPGAIILILCFLLYFILQKIERFKVNKFQKETCLLYSICAIFITSFVFRKAFLIHGYNTIFQNLPTFLRDSFFQEITLSKAIAGIGFLPILIGIFVVYWTVFREGSSKVYLYLSMAIVVGILLWLKLIPISLGMSILGVIFVIFFGLFYKQLFDFISQTKISHYKMLYVFALVILFLVMSLSTAFKFTQQGLATEAEVGSMNWIYFNTPDNSTILAPLKHGHLITALANRINVADTDFILAKNIDERIGDINKVYLSSSYVDVVEILEKYGANYIYLPEKASFQFDIPDCMKKIYDADVIIYASECETITRRADFE